MPSGTASAAFQALRIALTMPADAPAWYYEGIVTPTPAADAQG
ncbi:hypothetical protein ACIRJS_39965 [Streptomyces sp. NPDC102340]|nr:hypothetical protein [Streptomyces sp. NBC_01016]MCX4834443.1 hypothetical protein [Streptomyces sp. NBC_01016]